MALNLKTLGTRSLSALVFVILLIGCVYWNYYTFSLFFLAVSIIGLNEFFKIAEKLGAKPYKIIGYLSAFILYFNFTSFNELSTDAVYRLQTIFHSAVIILPFLILTVALFSKEPDSIKNAMFTIGGALYAVLPFALLNVTVFFSEEGWGINFEPKLILGVIFLIWSNDTFAYLGGSLFGKNKMIERVSPGKTWEGTAIGVIITFAISFSFNLIYPISGPFWPILGFSIPILATIGDLIESKLKREAGIKDSGNIMPGHGGILDRFDSLIFVSPFAYLIFSLYFN